MASHAATPTGFVLAYPLPLLSCAMVALASDRFADEPVGSAPGHGSLSVAVCTRDRTAQLERALRSLLDQELAPAEILVIDNAPADEATRQMVRQKFPAVRYVREPASGPAFARNRALIEARGAVVAFLDDDAVAHRGWARALTQELEDERVAACTGRVEALALETEAQRLFEANGGFSRGVERLHLPRDAKRPLHGLPAPLIAWAVSVGSGCSFAVRRVAALETGGFDPALDPGAPSPGGEDLDMLWRLLSVGHAVVYRPDALAWHEHRRELQAVCDQLAGQQRALTAFLAKTAVRTRGVRRIPVLGFLAWRLLKPGARLVRRLVGRDPLPARQLLRMWGSSWRGLFAPLAARRLDHGSPAGDRSLVAK